MLLQTKEDSMGATGRKAYHGSGRARAGVIGKVHGHMHARKSGMTKHGNHPKKGSMGCMSSRPTKKI